MRTLICIKGVNGARIAKPHKKRSTCNMANEKQLSDAEIAERGGMGVIADQEEEKDPTDPEEGDESESEDKSEDESKEEDEESESEDEESEDEEDEEAEPTSKKTAKKKSSDKSEDESEEEDEDKEDDDEEEDEDEGTGRKRTVPYGKLKEEREKRKTLQKEIDKVNKLLAAARADKEGTDEDEERDELEDMAKRLGEELGQDSKGLAKVLKAAVDLARKELGGKKLPKDLQEKLKLLDKMQEREKEEKELSHFNKEWDGLVPALKKRFPGASDSMLAEAKKEMDKLSHDKKYHRYDLDYVLFKEGKKFEALLKAAPGNRSGESGKQIGTGAGDDGDEEETMVNIEDITPEIMRRRENKEISRRSSSRDDEDPNFQIIDPIDSDE